MDQTTLYNLALGRIGINQVVASPTENTTPAKACNRVFDYCRQEVLRAFPWGFATRAEALAEVADQTFPGWRYVYQYPANCLMVRNVADEDGIRYARSYALTQPPYYNDLIQKVRQPFEIALKDDEASRVILSDIDDAWGFFTFDVTNVSVWPSDFAGVVAWRMAMEVGGPLEAKADLVTAAEARYVAWESRAAAKNMNEAKDDRMADSPSISARY